jgi:large subunit ribosomal protein L1
MPQSGKKFRKSAASLEVGQKYTLEQAIALVKEMHYTKFDESVDAAIKLGVDPKKTDQMVRGSVVLPHGTGKTFRVLVFAKGEKEKEALDAGAEFVGAEDLIDKIQKGWLDFDSAVATPDLMGLVGRLGRVLGPRGLMPNPKTGTVTFDVGRAVRDIKAGKVEYRVDKGGIVHARFGRVSFAPDSLQENFRSLMEGVLKSKPSTSKGQYLRGVTISSTMGPGVKLDVTFLQGPSK